MGDEVTVEVLDVDMDHEGVCLSLKATQEDPWPEREAELDEPRAAADRYMREGKEARSIARALWAAMPAAGRLAYFESDSSWLPGWIVEEE